jgi:hypothetical protein
MLSINIGQILTFGKYLLPSAYFPVFLTTTLIEDCSIKNAQILLPNSMSQFRKSGSSRFRYRLIIQKADRSQQIDAGCHGNFLKMCFLQPIIS